MNADEAAKIGTLTSVGFSLDNLYTFTGADYFRRWHGDRVRKGGRLLVH